jgi:hypothetical protein
MLKMNLTLTSAIDKHKEILAELEITNDGSGSSEIGNYKYVIRWKDKFSSNSHSIPGSIKGWHRLENNALQLVREILDKHNLGE